MELELTVCAADEALELVKAHDKRGVSFGLVFSMEGDQLTASKAAALGSLQKSAQSGPIDRCSCIATMSKQGQVRRHANLWRVLLHTLRNAHRTAVSLAFWSNAVAANREARRWAWCCCATIAAMAQRNSVWKSS